MDGDPEADFVARRNLMVVSPETRLVGARDRVESTVGEREVRPLVRVPCSVRLDSAVRWLKTPRRT